MKTMTIGVRMTPEIKEKLQKIADKEMRSISNLVLKILTDYLKDYEKSKK
jgi:predicted transcriptional regulator